MDFRLPQSNKDKPEKCDGISCEKPQPADDSSKQNN